MRAFMNTGKVTRLSATMAATGRRGMAGGPVGDKLPYYKRMRGVVEQHTSPFEIQHVNGLLANFGAKFKHKVFDVLPDMIPAALTLGFIMWYTNHVNERKERESRY
mmetsp:Transcript_40101/g.126074  ORF Transcript_40101/g.126074 Transcript_40101/m.126074 type:complete len:106 (-) Transcript_40101:1433-1750(-)